MKYRIKKVHGKLAVKASGSGYEVGYNRVLFPRLTQRPARVFAELYMYSK